MKRFFHMRLAVCGLIFIVGVVAASIGIHAGVGPKKIRVIYTNDTLGYLDPCG